MEISVQGEVMKELGQICNELYNVSWFLLDFHFRFLWIACM